MSAVLLTADRIVTVDDAIGDATAVVIDGERIVAVGDAAELAEQFPGVRRRDYPGATIIPGLIESHVHPAYTGFTDGWADCRPEACASIADIQDALRGLEVAPGDWLIGWGYDDTLLAEDRHPTRDDLDAVCADRPILIRHVSGHFAVGNSAALAASGIDDSSDPALFPRGDDGRLTGLAWEVDAVHTLGAAIPAPSVAQIRDALSRSLDRGRRRGITTMHDMGVGLFGGPPEVEAYESLAREGALPVRVAGFLRGDQALSRLDRGDDVFSALAAPDPMWRIVGAKFWSDGSIQGLSAALRMPYACDHSLTGELLYDEAVLADQVARVSAAGGQVAVHANGDAAVGATIRALTAAAAPASNPAGKRHRIEHCQVTVPDDLTAIAEAGLGVSFFINHVYYWGDRHRDRFLGADRASRIDPLREADDLGILYGLHSDCPITPMDPLASIKHASQRRTRGGDVLGDDQRISVERALQAMTIDSARLVGMDADTGSITPGKYADLVVLDGALADVVSSDNSDLLDVYVGGVGLQPPG